MEVARKKEESSIKGIEDNYLMKVVGRKRCVYVSLTLFLFVFTRKGE